MSVRTALGAINEVIQTYFAEQESELDPATQFCLTWYKQYGTKPGRYGEADILSKAKDISIARLERDGVLKQGGGWVQIYPAYSDAYQEIWDPRNERSFTIWSATHHLVAAHRHGNPAAAEIAAALGGYAEQARTLAYELYEIASAPGHGWAEEALGYNSLVADWPAIQQLAAQAGTRWSSWGWGCSPSPEAPLAVRGPKTVQDFNKAADEAQYAAWTEAHPAGFVINAGQTGHGRVMLHRARCTHIQSTPGWPAVTTAKHEICAEDPAELEAWAARLGGTLDFCRSCDPLPGHPRPAPAARKPSAPAGAPDGDYPKLLLTRKTGDEPLHQHGARLEATVLDFWRWAMSDLVGNAARGVLAEYIVARALGLTDGVRVEWDAYDLETPRGVKIEVKSSAYLQSWYQTKLSHIVFSIRPAHAWDATTNVMAPEAHRQACLYVFCLLNHRDKATLDPLNLDQWTFYLIGAAALNDQVGQQQTLSLSRLLSLHPRHATYAELAACVAELSE